jgi:hypothetical protein
MLSLMVAASVAAAQPNHAAAIDAEREFAAYAQTNGQWTAFRKYAAPTAVMFAPKPVNAHAFLKGQADPKVSVYWWPGRSYVSCDGRLAINTGPWVRGYGKSVGYFTTVWQRQRDGQWRWLYDAGNELKFARDEGGDIAPVIAACGRRTKGPTVLGTVGAVGYRTGGGQSSDGTLVWSWTSAPKGDRRFLAQLWDGKAWQAVIDDKVDAGRE